MFAMFRLCENLESIEGIDNWNVTKISNMWAVFSGCYNLISFKGIEKWDMSNVKDVSGMFNVIIK